MMNEDVRVAMGRTGDVMYPRAVPRGAAALAAAPFWSMTGALATVDVQDLAGDKGSVFQKHDRVDDVLNFSHTSDWMQLREELMCLGSVHRRLHNAGSNCVHPNSLFCVLDRQGLGGCVQPTFGHRGKDRRNVAVGVIDKAGRNLHDVTRPLL